MDQQQWKEQQEAGYNSPQEPQPPRKKLSALAIICIVLGVIAALCLLVLAAVGPSYAVRLTADLLEGNQELEEKLERWGERFGADMERWGEGFGTDLERWGEEFGASVSDLAQNVVDDALSWTSDSWKSEDLTGLIDESTLYTCDPQELANLKIEMVVGDIEVLPSEDDQFRAEYTAYVNSNMESRHSAQFTKSAGGLTFRQKFRNNMGVSGGRNRFGLKIYLPAEMELDLDVENVNGQLLLQGASPRSLDLDLVNGDVAVSETQLGMISIDATNSSVSISTDHLQPQIEIDNVNGSIRIEVEKNASYRYEGEIVNGSAKIGGNSLRKEFSGEINGGRGLIETEIVNGSLEICEK